MTNSTADEKAIRELLDHTTDAWNRNDADAYGAAFTENASYVAFFGGIYRGRHEIIESHRVLFAKVLRGTRMYNEVVEIRLVAPDAAVLVTRGDVAKRAPKRLAKVQSYTVVCIDGNWQFASFQNTRRSRVMRFLTYRTGSAAIPSIDK